MEQKWLSVPADRKPSRVLRLCVLLGIAALALIFAVPGNRASGNPAQAEAAGRG